MPKTKRQVKIALDYGGVLQAHEWIQELAKALLKDGHEVYCITAVPTSWKGNGRREKEVEALGIPFTGIRVTYHECETEVPMITVTAQQAWDAGLGKAAVMKELGIKVLYDDLPEIILAVRSQGLIGVHVA